MFCHYDHVDSIDRPLLAVALRCGRRRLLPAHRREHLTRSYHVRHAASDILRRSGRADLADIVYVAAWHGWRTVTGREALELSTDGRLP